MVHQLAIPLNPQTGSTPNWSKRPLVWQARSVEKARRRPWDVRSNAHPRSARVRQKHKLWSKGVRPPHRILEYWILSFEIGEYWILSFWSPRILNIEFLSPENIEYWVFELRECWILPLLTATEYWTLRIVGPEYWILSFWGEEYWILTQAWWSQCSVWWPQEQCRIEPGGPLTGLSQTPNNLHA